MKRHLSYFVLVVALLVSGVTEAKVYNYMGAYAQVGEWTLMPSQSAYGPSFGVNGGVGFVYELQAARKYSETRFLLDLGVGAWGGMTSYIQSSDMLVELKDQEDLQHDKFDYIYEIRNRHDRYNNLALQVPLMIGFQHNRFYMLAGVKFDANILTKAYTTANLDTYGRYKEFENHYNMPEYQFFQDEKLYKKADASLKLNMSASLELGGRVGFLTNSTGYDVPQRKVECRFAAFLDYGITDIHTPRSLDGFATPTLYDTDPESENYIYESRSMIENLEVNDLMSTDGFAAKVNSLVIGVKFTILFQLPEQKKCVMCKDAYVSSYRGGRSGRGVKYEE